jgi:hypothetical protein
LGKRLKEIEKRLKGRRLKGRRLKGRRLRFTLKVKYNGKY